MGAVHTVGVRVIHFLTPYVSMTKCAIKSEYGNNLNSRYNNAGICCNVSTSPYSKWHLCKIKWNCKWAVVIVHSNNYNCSWNKLNQRNWVVIEPWPVHQFVSVSTNVFLQLKLLSENKKRTLSLTMSALWSASTVMSIEKRLRLMSVQSSFATRVNASMQDNRWYCSCACT